MQCFDADFIGLKRVEPLSMSQRAAWYLRRQQRDMVWNVNIVSDVALID